MTEKKCSFFWILFNFTIYLLNFNLLCLFLLNLILKYSFCVYSIYLYHGINKHEKNTAFYIENVFIFISIFNKNFLKVNLPQRYSIWQLCSLSYIYKSLLLCHSKKTVCFCSDFVLNFFRVAINTCVSGSSLKFKLFYRKISQIYKKANNENEEIRTSNIGSYPNTQCTFLQFNTTFHTNYGI